VAPSSRGLGHHPFTVRTGVRIPVGSFDLHSIESRYAINKYDCFELSAALILVFIGLIVAGYFGGTPAVLAALFVGVGMRMIAAFQRRVIYDRVA
jgi:hypothetical protein